jgi:uncharacterized membrane protein
MQTVVGLFDRFEDAQNAVQELSKSGIHGEDINFISRDAIGDTSQELGGVSPIEQGEGGHSTATSAGIGAVLGGFAGLLVGLGALAIPGIGPVIAAGPVVSALAGAGLGAVSGGILAALVDMGIPEEHANIYAEGIRRGGTLVTIRAEDQQVDRVLAILNRYHPVDIAKHSQAWKQKNWSRFDPSGEPLVQKAMEYNHPGYRKPAETAAPVVENRPLADTGLRGQAVLVTGDEPERVRDIPDLDYGDLGDQNVKNQKPADVDKDSWHEEDMGRSGIPHTGASSVEIHNPPTASVAKPFRSLDWKRYEPIFQDHYQRIFVVRGHDYEYYQPAYQFGYEFAQEPRYRNLDWNSVEPEMRTEWLRRGAQNTWEDIKDAVRYAWDSVIR